MPVFNLNVVEVRKYTVRYVVEASSYEEAVEKAKRGDTLDEDDEEVEALLSRQVLQESQ